MRDAYPGSADLAALLIASGLISNPPTTVQQFIDEGGYIGRAISEWERATRFIPFMGDTDDQTVWYNPRDLQQPIGHFPFLDTAANGGPGGVLSVTSLYVGVTSTSTGTALTQDYHYAMRPRNAALKNMPYTYIEFIRPPYVGLGALGSVVDSIKLVCKRGYWTKVDEAAYQAILSGAAALAVSVLSRPVSPGILEITDDDVKIKYDPDAFGKMQERYQKQFDTGIMRFRRMSL